VPSPSMHDIFKSASQKALECALQLKKLEVQAVEPYELGDLVSDAETLARRIKRLHHDVTVAQQKVGLETYEA